MKQLRFALVLCGALLTTACASVSPQALRHIEPSADDDQSARLVVYRQDEIQGGLSDVFVGTDDGYFMRLGRNEYAEVTLRSGFHELKAKAKGSVPSNATLKLNPSETVCIEARPNREELHLLVIPFVNALVPSFVLEETECVDLSRYERGMVTSQES